MKGIISSLGTESLSSPNQTKRQWQLHLQPHLLGASYYAETHSKDITVLSSSYCMLEGWVWPIRIMPSSEPQNPFEVLHYKEQ